MFNERFEWRFTEKYYNKQSIITVNVHTELYRCNPACVFVEVT